MMSLLFAVRFCAPDIRRCRSSSVVSPLAAAFLLRSCFFFLMIRRPPISTLFPYPTLFRSRRRSPPQRDRHRDGPDPEDDGAPRQERAPRVERRAGRALACRGEPPCGPVEGRENVRRRSEEHTSELQSRLHLVCRLLLEKKK